MPRPGSRVPRTAWAIVVAVVLCVAAAFVWWPEAVDPTRSVDAELMRRMRDAKDGETVVLVLEGPQPPAKDSAPAERRPDYAAQLRSAPDLLGYVRSLLGAARAGDHAAQFFIFRAFDKCYFEYRSYFGRRMTQEPLDDALRRAAGSSWPLDPEEVRRVHTRCFRLLDSGAKEFGDRYDWLRQASEGGYPLAQVHLAEHQARQARKDDSDDAAAREARRLLLAQALRSREPEVVFEIGASAYITVAVDDEPAWDDRAWVLAACLRGLDCAPQSEIARTLCLFDRACQPYESVPDLIRRDSETEFPALEDKARWINEKIDAGDWAALGF